MNIKIEQFEGFNYIIKYPVIIFLHGAGCRGNDINILKNNPYFNIVNNYSNFPFITVAPQCSNNTWFDMFEQLKNLHIKYLMKTLCIVKSNCIK